MKIRKEKMADKYILGLRLMKGVLMIELPYYDILIMTNNYYESIGGLELEEEKYKKAPFYANWCWE